LELFKSKETNIKVKLSGKTVAEGKDSLAWLKGCEGLRLMCWFPKSENKITVVLNFSGKGLLKV